MPKVKVALVGAGSRSFGPATVADVLLSAPLRELGVELALMDVSAQAVEETRSYAEWANGQEGGAAKVTATTDLGRALDGADFVVDAVEVSRDVFWAMDFHVPRKHGFQQVYGENGGPGSHFHALRNMRLIVEIALAMEERCPGAPLLNYTNPMHKLCTAAVRLSGVQTIGLCHGVGMGLGQVAALLERDPATIAYEACGINHFTFFQKLADKQTGEDLYPALRAADRAADPLYDWHEVGLSRVILRRYGLYPSPGANHIGEYLGWADEFYASNVHWYYDPADGAPWQTGVAPQFCYHIGQVGRQRSVHPPLQDRTGIERNELRKSGELAVPIMECLAAGVSQHLDAVNVPNEGSIPNLPPEAVVEVPADGSGTGLVKRQMAPLPEGVAALMRLQCSVHELLVEAYAEGSKAKLVQALLLEPTVGSYRRCVEMVDEMLTLQKELLPPLE